MGIMESSSSAHDESAKGRAGGYVTGHNIPSEPDIDYRLFQPGLTPFIFYRGRLALSALSKKEKPQLWKDHILILS
jgi:hypothetical protein